jgi:hypothetical protein
VSISKEDFTAPLDIPKALCHSFSALCHSFSLLKMILSFIVGFVIVMLSLLIELKRMYKFLKLILSIQRVDSDLHRFFACAIRRCII